MPSLTKILSKTPIVGAAIAPGVRSAGKSLLNGSGTCGWNWVIAYILIQCARRSLLLPSQLGRLQLPTRLLRCRGMGQPKSLWAGKQAASLVVTLLSSRMAPYAALPTRSSQRMSGVGKPMGACVWCTLPAFAVAVLVRCANSANGWAR